MPNPLGDLAQHRAKLASTKQTATIFKGKPGKCSIFAVELRIGYDSPRQDKLQDGHYAIEPKSWVKWYFILKKPRPNPKCNMES
jgi:hypothetical protein